MFCDKLHPEDPIEFGVSSIPSSSEQFSSKPGSFVPPQVWDKPK